MALPSEGTQFLQPHLLRIDENVPIRTKKLRSQTITTQCTYTCIHMHNASQNHNNYNYIVYTVTEFPSHNTLLDISIVSKLTDSFCYLLCEPWLSQLH